MIRESLQDQQCFYCVREGGGGGGVPTQKASQFQAASGQQLQHGRHSLGENSCSKEGC